MEINKKPYSFFSLFLKIQLVILIDLKSVYLSFNKLIMNFLKMLNKC